MYNQFALSCACPESLTTRPFFIVIAIVVGVTIGALLAKGSLLRSVLIAFAIISALALLLFIGDSVFAQSVQESNPWPEGCAGICPTFFEAIRDEQFGIRYLATVSPVVAIITFFSYFITRKFKT